MEKIFKVHDVDGDGMLNKSEAKQYIAAWSEEEMGYTPGKDMIDMVLEELDTGGDGLIKKKEIFMHLKRSQETREQ